MQVGVVKMWSSKGFGFIEREDADDVFCHYSAIVGTGFRSLREFEPVEFDVELGANGPQARNVRRIPRTTKERPFTRAGGCLCQRLYDTGYTGVASADAFLQWHYDAGTLERDSVRRCVDFWAKGSPFVEGAHVRARSDGPTGRDGEPRWREGEIVDRPPTKLATWLRWRVEQLCDALHPVREAPETVSRKLRADQQPFRLASTRRVRREWTWCPETGGMIEVNVARDSDHWVERTVPGEYEVAGVAGYRHYPRLALDVEFGRDPEIADFGGAEFVFDSPWRRVAPFGSPNPYARHARLVRHAANDKAAEERDAYERGWLFESHSPNAPGVGGDDPAGSTGTGGMPGLWYDRRTEGRGVDALALVDGDPEQQAEGDQITYQRRTLAEQADALLAADQADRSSGTTQEFDAEPWKREELLKGSARRQHRGALYGRQRMLDEFPEDDSDETAAWESGDRFILVTA